MYLSKLELVGFKSFAQKTSLKFTNGISAIVGPNGCGKSNIVDAIRWVLGEQKTSILRSDIMENVIFNGTKYRKPISMAEVSLTIENNKNILPVEYNEVVITRRLFRSGESEYLLNNNKCRLRDIVNLFMDTGLAPDSYSVIELKMVEAILSGRGEDRRGLFEEAAGIKKYKVQRKEAEKKLNDVANDLSRINDIVVEVRKNVNSLQRHAQKTRRYNILNEEYRTKESILYTFQYNKFNDVCNNLTSEINTLQDTKKVLEKELNDRKNILEQLKNEFSNIDIDLNDKNKMQLLTIQDIENKKQFVAVSNEKIKKIDDDELRLENDIKDTKWKLENTKNDIEKTNNSIAVIEIELLERGKILKTSIDERDVLQTDTNEERNKVLQYSNEIATLKNNVSMLKANLCKNDDKIITLNQKIENSFEDKKSIQEKINNCTSKIDNSDETIKEFENLIKKYESALIIEKERQTNLQLKLDGLRENINETRDILTNKKTTFNFLENLVDTSDTSKFLLSNNQWSSISNKLMFSEIIAIDDELKHIIPIIINNSSDYFVVNNKDEANKAISLLCNNKKGKAGFICLDSIPKIDKPKDIKLNNIIGFFSEIVRVPDNIRNALRLLFEGVVVANNSKNLNEIFSNPNVKAVITLDAEYFHRAGTIRGGSITEGETARIGKKEKMDAISKEIKELEIKIGKLINQQSELNNELKSIDIQTINSQIRETEDKKRSFENSIAQIKLYKQGLQNEFELIEKNNDLYKLNIIEIKEENKNIEFQIKQTENLYNEAYNIFTESQNNLLDLENKLKVKNDSVHENDKLVLQNDNELKNINNDLERLKRQLGNYSNTISNRNVELIQNSKTREELKKSIIDINKELEETELLLNKIKNECDFIAQNKKNIQEQMLQIENDISQYQKTFNNVIDDIHKVEIQFSQTNSSIQNIIQNFFNNYQIDISKADIKIPENFSEKDTIELITELKQKLQKLGSINFAAIEEFESENERLQFIEKQIDDLSEAKKTLRITIDEINQIAEKTFIDTFNKIRLNFQNLFKKLFDEEAETDIFFDATNPLESEINITAKPPNKKPNSIEQLSGGEKTLTAIALLFAIYLVKPSPFCILDEIDAPLDDANVYRFLNIIREFSKETQFLIVTHNKTTMSAADTLYGVTMQEPGVSKTASVRLDEIE